MIKNLKRRLILTTMLVIILAFTAIFVGVCIFTYSMKMKETYVFLEQSLMDKHFAPGEGFNNMDIDDPPQKPHMGGSFELPKMFAFRIFVDNSGKIEHSSLENSKIDKDTLKLCINQVLSSEDVRGTVDGADLIYCKKPTQGGTNIAFTSSLPVDNAVSEVALTTLIICLVCIVVFFFLVERLASYSIKPVQMAWESQHQFVADASHDLKTPITVILANNDILLSKGEETVQSQQKWIESTKEEALKMKSLVSEMLDLAKSENPHTVVFEQTDLSQATVGGLLQMEAVAFERGVSIEQQIDEGIKIKSSKDDYTRILSILVDNAIKYSKSGEKINVSLSQYRHMVALSVSNPSFIEAEELSHIFKRFYRSDKSRADTGHGLGLAIAKSLASSLGGDLTVTSTKAQGTTFTLTLRK